MYKPWYWVNEVSKNFFKEGYVPKNVNYKEHLMNICKKAERILGMEKENFAERFYTNISKGWYLLPTPNWSSFLTDNESGISCFSSYCGDSINDIMYTASEIGKMSQIGGGTSIYLGDVRHRGAPISSGTVSSGAVSFLPLFETVTNVVSQKSRRGYVNISLPIDHPDIEEFLLIRTEGYPVQKIAYTVTISDEFMKKLEAFDPKALKIMSKVIANRFNQGFPFISFIDTQNKNTVDVYKDLKMKILGNNLCITGDTMVLTDKGYKSAKSLYDLGTPLTLFDGKQPVESSNMKLREKDADIYLMTLENGLFLKCTDYHNIPIVKNNKLYKTPLKDVKIGEHVALPNIKGLFGDVIMLDEAFLLGMYQGDGTQTKNEIAIDIWEKDFDLINVIEEKFAKIHYKYKCDKYSITNQYGKTFTRNRTPAKFIDCVVSGSTVKKKRLISRTLKKALNFKKNTIPDWIWQGTEETQWEYIKGLFYTDGTVNINNSKGKPLYLSLSSNNRAWLSQIQLLLNNLGLKSKIHIATKAKEQIIRGEVYQFKEAYRLIINNKNSALVFNKHTQFLDRKNKKIENRNYRDNTKKTSKVVSIKYIGKEDVYCPTVNSTDNIFVVNGMLTYNCQEIALPVNEHESFVCNILAMNALHYDEWKDTDAIELAVYFMDSVLTDFIDKMKKEPLMAKAVRFAEFHRALGLGCSNYHYLLQSKNLPFESEGARELNKELFKTIQTQAWKASEKMAKDFGKPQILQVPKYNRRHTTLTAVAPNTSSQSIVGLGSCGIEPLTNNFYVKKLAKDKVEIKNVFLEKLLEEKGQNTDEIWTKILKDSGSVQNLDFLTKEEKDVFKTFKEISQLEILQQAADRQQFIDQSQSLNLALSSEATDGDSMELIYTAWKKGVKSLYYQINYSAAMEFTNKLNCESCAG